MKQWRLASFTRRTPCYTHIEYFPRFRMTTNCWWEHSHSRIYIGAPPVEIKDIIHHIHHSSFQMFALFHHCGFRKTYIPTDVVVGYICEAHHATHIWQVVSFCNLCTYIYIYIYKSAIGLVLYTLRYICFCVCVNGKLDFRLKLYIYIWNILRAPR